MSEGTVVAVTGIDSLSDYGRVYDYLDGLTLAEAVAQNSEAGEEEQSGVRFGSGFQQSAA